MEELTINTKYIQSLESRISRLEAENSSLRRRTLAPLWGLALMAMLLLGINCAANNKQLSVESLTIRDGAGQVRWQISYQDTSEWISQRFYDQAGTERIRLAIGADGTARQRLYDQQGLLRVSSSTYHEGHPKAPGVAGSVYYGKGEKKRIRLATNAKGMAVQQFRDGQGETRFETGIDTLGTLTQKHTPQEK